MPRAVHGDEWHLKIWGVSSHAYEAFSLEEAPPALWRGSSQPAASGYETCRRAQVVPLVEWLTSSRCRVFWPRRIKEQKMSANDRGPQEVEKVRIAVLLVDDEEDYVNVLSKRLLKRKMDVTTASSGTEAIQRLRKKDFDVAILDLKMEDMDGIEVLKIFKKMVPEMEVIMLTGHGSESAARAGVELGAFDYLTKPCEFEELCGKIGKAYERRCKV